MKRSAPLARRTPLRAKGKPAKTGKTVKPKAKRIKPRRVVDEAYLKRVRALPCMLCVREGLEQTSRTEAHHIRRRPDGSFYGAGEKAGDYEAVPLCAGTHHWNGVHCQAKLSHRAFEAKFGDERDLVAETQRLLGFMPKEVA